MAVRNVDDRIGQASTPQELIFLAQVRGELLRQDDEHADRQHRRYISRVELWGKLGLSLAASGTGVGLVISGLLIPGMFSLGVGAFWLARPFVMAYFGKTGGGGE